MGGLLPLHTAEKPGGHWACNNFEWAREVRGRSRPGLVPRYRVSKDASERKYACTGVEGAHDAVIEVQAVLK